MLESVAVTTAEDRALNVTARVATYYRASEQWQLSRPRLTGVRARPVLLVLLGVLAAAFLAMKLWDRPARAGPRLMRGGRRRPR